MAGMFYSLEEAAEKLNMSVDQVSELVEQRKLREFRDGNKVLFKVNEVEELMKDSGLVEPAAEPETSESEIGPEDLGLVVSDEEQEAPKEEAEPEISQEPAVEEPSVEEAASSDSDLGIFSEEEAAPAGQEPAKVDDISMESDLDIFGADSETSIEQPAEQSDATEDTGLSDDIGLAKESPAEDDSDKTDLSLTVEGEEGSTHGIQLSSEDTATTQEGINVLNQTDSDFSLTEDTRAETKAMEEAATLEDIESDVNLDSFGSGSGLLDLSLQADDTSLGGILDEIYTPEGDEEKMPADASAADVAAAADKMMSGSGEQSAVASTAMVQGYVEPEPDTSSNVFGIVLIIPLIAVIYGIIATLAGQSGILPNIIPEGMMSMYVLGGLLFVGLALSIYGYMAGASSVPKPAKPKKEKKAKPKKEKKAKPKKEKKVKPKKG